MKMMDLYKPYPGKDLTTGENFFFFFSSFWTQIFQGKELPAGMGDATSWQICQLYQDFLESVNRVSAFSIPVFHKELIKPVILKRSQLSIGPDKLKFGAGAVFGPQPDGKYKEGVIFQFGGLEKRSSQYYFPLPDGVSLLGPTMINRLYAPSVIMSLDNDYIQLEGIIAFAENPFNNPLLPIRKIAGTDGTYIDEEIILWSLGTKIEAENLYNQFGYIFTTQRESTEFYKAVIQEFFRLYSDGPSIDIMDSFVASLAEMPIIVEPQETVQSVDVLGGQQYVITDLGVYKIPVGTQLRANVQKGVVLLSGQPLTKATYVVDRAKNTFWWQQESGILLPRSYMQAPVAGGIGFMNGSYPVTLMPEAVEDKVNRRPARFFLTGLPADIQKFWEWTEKEQVGQDTFLGTQMWVAAGYVQYDIDGNVKLDDTGRPMADFTKTVAINPLEFLMDECIGDALIIVQIEMTQVDFSKPSILALKYLKDTAPVFASIFMFVHLTWDETYAFNTVSTVLDLCDAKDLISLNPDNFPAGVKADWENETINAEAIGLGRTSDMISEVFDLSDPANVVESIKTKKEKSCKSKVR